MPLWGKVDNAANSAIFATAQVNKATSTAERDALFNNVTANAYFDNATVGQFGVDANEQQASVGGPSHAGWVLRTEGSGGRAGRVFYETLVAGGSMSGDANDDAILPDVRIVIRVQPEDVEVAAPNAATFEVSAYTVPAGGTITYQWYEDAVAIGGATNASYTVANTSGLDGTEYFVSVSSAGVTANSQTVTLTVT